MCHILLLMPLLGLPIFWLTPLSFAIPIYAILVLVSALLYWSIWRAMRKPLETEADALIGTTAQVVSESSPGDPAQYVIRARGELWTARSTDVLEPEEKVRITALDGISLVVERRNNDSHPEQPFNVETKQTGAKTNERHCH